MKKLQKYPPPTVEIVVLKTATSLCNMSSRGMSTEFEGLSKGTNYEEEWD